MNDDAQNAAIADVRDNTTILVIDDDPANLAIVTDFLEAGGYKALVAEDGESGLERALYARPDLILLDIMMPGIDGFETCRRLKGMESTKDIPVIFMTALAETEHKVKGFAAGAVDYITKPFQREDVIARVSTHLRLRDLTERLEQKVSKRTAELTAVNQQLREETAERQQTEVLLRKSNRAYKALSHSNQALLLASEESDLLREVCRIIVKDCGYHLVWIGFAEHDEAKSVRPVAQSGYEEGYLDSINITWAATELGRGPTGTAIRTKQPVVNRDALTNQDFAPWKTEAMKRGYASSASFPMLTTEGETIGALNVYATQPDAFSPEEIDLLAELSRDLTYGIVSLRVRAERRKAEEALHKIEERFRMVVEATGAIVYDVDMNSGTALIVRGLEELLGFRPEEVPLTIDWWLSLVHLEDRATVEAHFRANGLNEEYFGLEYRVNSKKGDYVIVQDTGRLIRSSTGRIVRIVGGIIDITERKRMEEALRQSEELFKTLAENSTTAICLYQEKFVYVNPATERITGFTNEELYTMNPWDIFYPEYREEAMDIVMKRQKGEPFVLHKEVKIVTKAGEERWVEYFSATIDYRGRHAGLINMIDSTEKKKAEETIKYQVYHDLLTGLPNKALFMERLSFEIPQMQRVQKRIAVLLLDIDQFKNINDTLGYATGDALIQEVAGRLESCVREVDTVARIGGDKFIILLPLITTPADATSIAGKIMGSLKGAFIIGAYELFVTASIGISLYPDDGADTENLLKNADVAVNYAKDQGRNNYQFYNPAINVRTFERILLENRLRQTLERGELETYYQPIADLATGRIICAEALVRWKHPELGLLTPMQFIPIAEEIGFIQAIDEWVLRTVCDQSKAWQDAGCSSICITVNLSARQFQQPNLAEIVSGLLEGCKLAPRSIGIEITETIAMQDTDLTARNLSKLEKMGVRLSIDDFGTGYSSLSYLKKLPIHKLKIDKSFITGILEDPDYQAIVDAIIAMAHVLKLKVLAEGVETEEQMSFLSSRECDEIQGYFYGKPIPADKFQELIAKRDG